jgi:hypothetical protein
VLGLRPADCQEEVESAVLRNLRAEPGFLKCLGHAACTEATSAAGKPRALRRPHDAAHKEQAPGFESLRRASEAWSLSITARNRLAFSPWPTRADRPCSGA